MGPQSPHTEEQEEVCVLYTSLKHLPGRSKSEQADSPPTPALITFLWDTSICPSPQGCPGPGISPQATCFAKDPVINLPSTQVEESPAACWSQPSSSQPGLHSRGKLYKPLMAQPHRTLIKSESLGLGLGCCCF